MSRAHYPLLLALVTLLAAVLLPGFVSAQGGGGGAGAADGSYWSFGPGDTARLDVVDNPTGGVWTQAVSAGGFTGVASGTQGANTGAGATTATSSGAMSNGTDSYKVVDGKLAKLGADGKYHKGRKIPKPSGKGSRQTTRGTTYVSARGPVTGWEAAGGEEITSLPFPE